VRRAVVAKGSPLPPLAGIVLGALWLAAAAAGAAETATTGLTTFPNGLRLLVLPQPESATARVDVYVSLRGAARKPGLAHVVEHLMFCSSAGAPDGSLVDSLAMNVGDFGADTSLERIHLWSGCIPSRLPQALALEADRFARLQPTGDDLETQRRRVLGEFNLFEEIYIFGPLDRRVAAMAYGAGDSTGDPLLGYSGDIDAVTSDDVAAFIAESFRPEHTVVMVSGPVTEAEVAAIVATGLGALPATAGALEPRLLPLPPPAGPCWTTKTDQADDFLAVGFRLPCATTEDMAMAYLARTIMERENGRPILQFYGNEALLTCNILYVGIKDRREAEAAKAALGMFWEEGRRVVRNVEDSWSFERNRKANVEDLRELAAMPRERAEWRAQRLAADAELPDVGTLAAVIDTLAHARVAAYFTRHFTPERAYAAFALGHDKPREYDWRDVLRLRVNPYLEFRRTRDRLTADHIAPVLAAARAVPLGRSAALTLANGIPVCVITLPGAEGFSLGGVRSFPCLFQGREARHAGRLHHYEYVVNWAYKPIDAAVAPVGDTPGMNTHLDVTPHSMTIAADGATGDACEVAAAMHKRMKRSGLNNYAFAWTAEVAAKWVTTGSQAAPNRAQAWRFGRILGPDHALAHWPQPEAKSVADWSLTLAEALSHKVCATDNLTLVAVGSLTPPEVERCLKGTFGRLMPPQREPGPSLPAPRPGTSGRVFHDPSAEVAEITVSYAGGGIEATHGLGYLDLAAITEVLASRLRIAAAESGFDSLSIQVGMYPVGAQVMPEVDVVAPVRHVDGVLSLVLDQSAALRSRPVDADEEARARLRLAGALADGLDDPEWTRDLLVNCGLVGPVPADPLGDVCTLRPALLAEKAPRLFALDAAAWTVVADTTRTAVGAVLEKAR
jgi:predicted Zn-dependent peptidase